MTDTEAGNVFNASHVNISTVAAQIRGLQARALTPAEFEDVFLLIEYAQRETIKMFDDVGKRVKEVSDRERAVAVREQQVASKLRAIGVATTVKGNRFRVFGRG